VKVGQQHYRSIWRDGDVFIIDQTRLPHHFAVQALESLEDVYTAIRDMQVRGAPLIGATAAYGFALGLAEDNSPKGRRHAMQRLRSARPTAVNLAWALQRIDRLLDTQPPGDWYATALTEAERICDEDVAVNESIGMHGFEILRDVANAKPGKTLNILTHCNAGWLATVDWGTALAPIYRAFDQGIDLHVWVDETRPRNQGAALTAWELHNHGVRCTLITDNAGGHLMQTGQVDLCIVGTDRTVANGDVCNKIGTYLKALAAKANQVPFYVALPISTFDPNIRTGSEVPIEQRPGEEVIRVAGSDEQGEAGSVQICPTGVNAANPAFDITPAKFINGYITERGVLSRADLADIGN